MGGSSSRRGAPHTFPLHLVALLAGLVVSALVVGYFMQDDMSYRREQALRIDEVYSARIESLLDSLFHKTDVMESLIIAERGELSEETFNDLAKSLSDGVGIRAIQYLPGGTVRYVYPVEGNEPTIGGNIFEQPDRRDDALLALETRQITLSGPYELRQGGLGLVARNPIFMTDENGDEEFWGFAVIVLDLPAALDPIVLSQVEAAGLDYELSTSSAQGDKVLIAASSTPPGADAVEYAVHVPNHDWTLRLAPKDGWIDWALLLWTSFAGLIISVLVAVVVWQSRNKRRFLHELATTDELTGLHNRRWFGDEMERRCADVREPFVLFYLDLNGFKNVNDTLGHKLGDELLVQVAERFRAVCDGVGDLARIGGDEFVAAAGGLDAEGARRFADKLRGALDEPIAVGERTCEIGASVGMAAYPADGGDYDSLIRAADASMYADKRAAKTSRRDG
ncbi:diguanylate cyclase domain-containing protein [Arabiibacter massiliensis]|uniref:diguanylate cyclase domain-containing protein n=1 Tax=Arabiibacter massiliensis TaxID=1870985 RepID=UPI0009BC5F36|nr:diguanylate cyclase [Arabiibacter massiliensis]